MNRSKLASAVIATIGKNQPIKAVQIAEIISKDTGKVLNKKSVNSVLYSELRKKVKQDDKFNWSLVGTESSTSPTSSSIGENIRNAISSPGHTKGVNSGSETTDTSHSQENDSYIPKSILNKVASYYLECMSFERDSEVSVFSISKYETPEYVQLCSLPEVSDDFNSSWDQEDVRKLIIRSRKRQSNQKLYLGYPVFVRPTPKGTSVKLEPLFLFSFDLETDSGYPKLSNEAPRINLAGFKGYAEESGNLFDDLIQLQHDLGLDKDIPDLPKIDELILNLRNKRPFWPWVGDTTPSVLSDVALADISAAGIYNSAILVCGKGSKFTKGLEKELGHLKSVETTQAFKDSVLAEMLGVSGPKNHGTPVNLIEAIQLNHEQKNAVQSAFQNGLTVITGPPGTGKSQVVTALLVNAAREGLKVLFTSKNNKAVDVVEARVNGLCHQPFVLRLGAKELQVSLASKLSQLLSSHRAGDSRNNYERLSEKHDYLSQELKDLFSLMERVINLRNEIDSLDQGIQRARKKLANSFFEKDNKQLSIKLNDFDTKIETIVTKMQKAESSTIGKLVWLFYSKINRSKIDQLINDVKAFLDFHGIFVNSETKIEHLHLNIKDLKKVMNDSSRYYDLKVQIKNLKSFEDLCSVYKEIHAELVDTDQDLWKNWLQLTSYRMSEDQRKTLGEYISVLKYIVDANSTGEFINKKTWKDYYRLTEKVAPLLPVWAVTALSVNGRLPLEPGVFDLVIIDEASQCDIASIIPLLYRAKRAVILGDPNQLRHITTLSGKQDLQLIEKHNLHEYLTWGYAKNSCFDLAASISPNVITLREHHRSHQDIIEFSNQTYYNGALRIATKNENLKRLKSGLETNVEWHSVSGQVERYRGSGACNKKEAQAVFDYVEDLVKNRGYTGTIGIVTPFRGQVTLIRELFANSQDMTSYLVKSELLIDTVHKFQGDEKDLIVFSSVVSEGISESSLGFLRSQGNLFNVAITRAKSHLTVVGNQAVCRQSGVTYLASFVDYVESLKLKNKNKNLLESALTGEYPQVVYDPNTVSDWEVRFYKAMYKAGLRPIPQYKEDKYRLDFAIFDGHRKLNIEIDGEKYHMDWDGSLILEDQVRNDRLRELGWAVKRFWVFQVRDEEERCVQEIIQWLESAKRNSA